MINGLYKVSFQGQGAGNGVVVIRDGAFAGGDSALYYVGALHENGTTVTAHLETHRHSPGLASTLGKDDVTTELTGTLSGDSFTLNGPGGFRVVGTKLRNL